MTDGVEYPFTIRPRTAAEGGGYLIAFPDLPGCIASGRTVAAAIDAGADARQSWIEQRTAAGREVPQPRSVTDRPKPDKAPWIKAYIERIADASTRDEWNRTVADAVFKLLFGDPERMGETVAAMSDWRLPVALRVTGLIEAGFVGKKGRPGHKLEAQDDARLISSWLRRYPEMTFADAAYGFFVWFDFADQIAADIATAEARGDMKEVDAIHERAGDNARDRVERAEKILSVALPREARAFRPPRTGKRASRRVRLEKSRPL